MNLLVSPRLRRAAFLLAMTAMPLLAAASSARAQSRYSLEEIGRAWRARQDRIRSAHFAWTETVLVPKNSKVRPQGPLGPARRGPPEDMTIERKSSFTCDGDMMRYEERGARWIGDLAEFHPQWMLSVNDKETIKSYFDKDQSGRELFPPDGFIDRGPQYIDASNEAILPLLIPLRPFNPDVMFGNLDLKFYQVNERPAAVDGRECVVLEHEKQGLTLCLDPEREFIPVRKSKLHQDGRLLSQTDISYERAEGVGWLPSAWKRVHYADVLNPEEHGIVRQQVEAVVTSHWINRDVPKSEFQFEFPPGTRVSDARDGTRYIVRDEGRKRLIHPTEMRADVTYEDLASTETGQAGRRANGYNWPIIVGVIVGIAVLGICVRGVRRWLREGRDS